ncbi:hypothetical protein LZ30DRAFT_727146 [Colletotrichum cereale]|nr:hypothetical protein LZ30DRAFT_727146 [Colletotrichum cereale]
MPGSRNKASVIVPCCGQRDDPGSGTNGTNGTNGVERGNQRVQKAALTHLQGPGPDIPADEAGAHVRKRE